MTPRVRMILGAIAALVLASSTAGCARQGIAPRPFGGPPAVEVAVGRQPVDVAIGDLDGDGRADLAAAVAGEKVIAVRLARDTEWVAPPGDPMRLDVAPHHVALADLDGDGDLDIAAACHDSGAVAAWLGDGAGGFVVAPGSPATAITAGRPHNHGLVAGDLD